MRLKKKEKTAQKYENLKPISERMEATGRKAQKGAKKNQEYQHNSRNELVRKHWQKQVPQSHERREKNSYPIERPMLSNTRSFLLRIGQMLKKHTDINGRKYFTLLTKPAVRNANVKSQEWIEKHVSEAIPRNIPDRESMNALLKRMMLILQTDTEVKDMIQGFF